MPQNLGLQSSAVINIVTYELNGLNLGRVVLRINCLILFGGESAILNI